MKTIITITIDHDKGTSSVESETAKQPIPRVTIASDKPAYDPRPCLICDEDFAPKRIDQRLCGKPECKKEYMRRASNKYNKKKQSLGLASPQAFHPKPNAAQRRWNNKTPAEPIRHSKVDETEAAEVSETMREQRKNFKDLWNCAMCRNAGSLCTMHEGMTRDGKKPPFNLTYSRLEGMTI